MQLLIQYYSKLFKKHGKDSALSLGWQSETAQLKRFDVLCGVGDMNGAYILDVGAGLGDFYDFLLNRFPSARYRGFEINPELVKAAREKYPGIDIIGADFLRYQPEPAQYVVASGIFSLNIPNHGSIYRSIIRAMFTCATRGVAFNVLNIETHVNDDTYVAYSIPEMFEFCKTIAPKVVMRDDYLPYDATFYLYRP